MNFELLLSPMVWLIALGIFTMRIVSLALDTLRIIFNVRGQKGLSWVTGFGSVVLFLAAIAIILARMDNWLYTIAYAIGFATGSVIGMDIERRLTIGYILVTIVSPGLGSVVARDLRAEGFAVTEVPARGKDGAVSLMHCHVMRRDMDEVETVVLEADPAAFVIAEQVRPLQKGLWLG